MKSRERRLILIALAVVIALLAAGFVSSRAMAQDDGGNGGNAANRFCASSDEQHPVAARLAETYNGVGYEQIMQWFCEDRYGFGQIAMALQTSQLTGQSPESLLAERSQGRGWGQIWKDQGLIGNSEDGSPPPWAGHGRPPWAGPKHERTGDHPGRGNGGGNGNGNQPCWAGPGPLPEGCEKPTDEPTVEP